MNTSASDSLSVSETPPHQPNNKLDQSPSIVKGVTKLEIIAQNILQIGQLKQAEEPEILFGVEHRIAPQFTPPAQDVLRTSSIQSVEKGVIVTELDQIQKVLKAHEEYLETIEKTEELININYLNRILNKEEKIKKNNKEQIDEKFITFDVESLIVRITNEKKRIEESLIKLNEPLVENTHINFEEFDRLHTALFKVLNEYKLIENKITQICLHKKWLIERENKQKAKMQIE